MLATAGVIVLLYLLTFHENVDETIKFSKQSQNKAEDISVLQKETFKTKDTERATEWTSEHIMINDTIRAVIPILRDSENVPLVI